MNTFILIFCVLVHYCYAQQITVVQTARDGGYRLNTTTPVAWQPDFTSPVTVLVDPTTKFQTILGFGGALTESSAYVYSTLSKSLQQQVVEAYWGPTGIHYTVGRIHMNSCDFSVKTYSEDDTAADYTLSNFNIMHDQKWLIPLIKAAINASQAPINFFLTPWSAPTWMKANNNMNGSSHPLGMIQSPQISSAWALFFSKFITAYKNEGINFWGLTVQNEPENAASYESCLFTAEAERDFVKNYLGPRIFADHPEVKIMIFDHNKDHVAIWANIILSDPVAAKYVAGTAFHWYSGPQFENLQAAHQVDPTKFLLATEACNPAPVQEGSWPRGESYATDIMGDLNNWAVGWTDWNILLDPQGGPNHVNNFCDAPAIGDAVKETLYLNPTYYVMGQFSKFLLPGSVRLGSNCNGGLQCTAFLRPDNTVAVVVLNLGNNAVTFKLQQGTQAAKILIPDHAIATYTYANF
jgi:glucosylceramidase